MRPSPKLGGTRMPVQTLVQPNDYSRTGTPTLEIFQVREPER